MTAKKQSTFLKSLRVVSLIEGLSTLVLFFIAMPMKYVWDIPNAVSWPGRIHGGLFVLLVAMAILALKKGPISHKICFQVIVASLIPFGPFWMERKLKLL